MNALLDRATRSIRQHWTRLHARSAAHRQREETVRLAVERLVDQANPRLRAVSGYRRKLFEATAACLDYCHALAQRIPGPVTLDRPAWGTDPVLNALFGDWERVRQVISGPPVRAFVQETPLATDDCYAILAALPLRRNQLGMELVGDDIHRDVQQTVLTFVNHDVGLPGPDEDSVRARAAQAIMDTLVSVAVAEIAVQEERIEELEDRLRILRIKRKSVTPSPHGLDFLHDGSAAHATEYETLTRRIGEDEQALAEAQVGLATLDDYLHRLNAILAEPERWIGARTERVVLDRMNVVRESGDTREAQEATFLRGYRAGQPGRVLLLVRFKRADMIPASERLAEIERFMSV